MTTSRSSSRRAIADAEGVTAVAPKLSQSRCSGVLGLDLTRSSIGSQDLRQSEPRGLSQSGIAVSPSRFSQSSNCDTNRVQTSVGALMQPETGAWADRTSVFRQPVKPLGQDIIQAPLITAPQDALRLELRTNRLGNLRKTQALVLGVHDIPFTSVPAVAAPPSIPSPKGRRCFPNSTQHSSMRDILSKNGRSPFPTISPSASALCFAERLSPAAASFLCPEGRIPSDTVVDLEQDASPLLSSRRSRHTPNKKDRNCAGGSISVDLDLALKFLA